MRYMILMMTALLISGCTMNPYVSAGNQSRSSVQKRSVKHHKVKNNQATLAQDNVPIMNLMSGKGNSHA